MLKYFVDFVGIQAFNLVRRAFPEGIPWVVSTSAWIQRLFEDLKVAADSLSESRAEVCSLVVRQLLVLLTDRTLSSTLEEAGLTQRFRKHKNTLRELALKGVDLDQAAQACGVSASYLSRLFRRFDTVTPHQYLIRCRMAFAASLLLDPHLLVKEVATLSGYEDQFHFSRIFKTIYGRSPEAFRKLRA
jgi:AraC-like DNA-binding protein